MKMLLAMFLVALLVACSTSNAKETVLTPTFVSGSAFNQDIIMERHINSDEEVLEVDSSAVQKVLSVENEEVEETITEVTVIPRSQVYFWLGTYETGAVKDLISEGETKVYDLGGLSYEVTLAFVGEGPNNLGDALFQVNGQTLKPLAKKQSDVFGNRDFIFVRDVFYRE